jgi:hypothetical protein
MSETGMHATFRCLIAVLASLMGLMATSAVAQQGHPLVGIWSGEWGPSAKERHQVLIEMMWENTTLSGTINPGEPDAAPIKVGTLNSTNWTVHLEGEAKDESGKPLRIVVDGQIENLGSPKRTLTGTWIRGNTKGNFKLTRE